MSNDTYEMCVIYVSSVADTTHRRSNREDEMTEQTGPACACCGNAHETPDHTRLSRRRLLHASIVGAMAGALGGGLGLAMPSAARAQATVPPINTPDDALKLLTAGNQRFVDRKLTFQQDDLTILQQNSVEKQTPFASVLSCADSRVPVELIFDQSIGHVFVNRIAGNIATTEIIASVEYGAAVLGIKLIMVLGHQNCGAVDAAIAGKAVPGQISSLYRFLRPAVNAAGSDLRAATEANAKIQAQLLRESSPVLDELIKKGELKVVAGYFDVEIGHVQLLS
jgi:carbonic anhydrase